MGCGSSKTDDGKGKTQPAAGAAGEKEKQADKKAAKDENKEYAAKMQFLDKVPLLKRLPKDQHPIVASVCVGHDFKKGESVMKQGENGDEFYVIRTGEARVMVKDDQGNQKKVAMLKSGDYFGENALIRDEPRSATIVAETALTTFKITRARFRELGLNEKLQFANRKAVGAGAAKEQAGAKEPTPKTKEDRQLIVKALEKNENIQTMVTMDVNKFNLMCDACWKEDIKEKEEVIVEGDLNADYFYIVAKGSFEILITTEESSDKDGPQSAEKALSRGESKIVGTVSQGGSFGELALLYLVPRAATVKAKEPSTVWVIDRTNFKKILMKVTAEKIKEYVDLLGNVPVLQPLIREEKEELAKALVEMMFTKNEIILQQGDKGNNFYILIEGQVNVIKDGTVVKELEANASRKVVQYFGEQALLEDEARQATVQVVSEKAKALVLTRADFDTLLGPLKDIMSKQKEGTHRKSQIKNLDLQKLEAKRANQQILRKDLVKIGLLGCGGFGTVELYEHKETKNTYALKGLSKGYIVKTGMQDSVMNEKNILLMTNSEFIIKLHETYNGAQTLYFLLEPALGGELYATYNRKGLHGSEKHLMYYVAGVVFAFEHLHERHIIYRDLKPENMLLTELGHIKLTDMGLAKFVLGRTYTTCGTPDYFAPEVISSTGHTNALDWWTVGVLIFELMSGHPPFESAYPMQIYSKVMKGINKVPIPLKCQGVVGELIKALLKHEPSERLPMRPGGTQNLKEHKWFNGFDWEKMKKLELDQPYKPVVKSKKDLANFSARKEDMPRQLEYTDPGTGWDAEFATA